MGLAIFHFFAAVVHQLCMCYGLPMDSILASNLYVYISWVDSVHRHYVTRLTQLRMYICMYVNFFVLFFSDLVFNGWYQCYLL